MKKSEIYTKALVAVLDSSDFTAEEKLEVAEQLMADRSLAKYVEEAEEVK